jgi:RAD51-like protein 2
MPPPTFTASSSTLPLAELPLRPSTLTLLQQRGFVTLGELVESKESGAGLATLAAELQVELPKAMRLLREVQDCLTASSASAASETDKENHHHQQPSQPQSQSQSQSQSQTEASNLASEAATPDAPMILTPPPMLTASDLLAQLHPPHSVRSSRRNKTTSGTGTGTGTDASTETETETDTHGASHKSPSHVTPGGIISFCRSIDTLLFTGGFPLGSVTECAGLPGVGKTQLAMQLAVNARLPKSFGGVQGQTLYIDAEGSLVAERLHTMAQALLDHTQGTLRRRRPHDAYLPADFSKVEQILEGIHVFRVHDEASQTATIYSLPHWIEQINNNTAQEGGSLRPVKLIVVDSIAFHYRTHISSSKDFYLHRTRALTQLAAFLNDLARDYNVAVVCLNQMTTKVDNNVSRLVPALGESWAHAVTTRLMLSQDDPTSSSRRVCTLVKSPCMPSGTAYYQVMESGIRDVSTPNTEGPRNKDDGDHDGDHDGDGYEEVHTGTSATGTSSNTRTTTSANQNKRLRTN